MAMEPGLRYDNRDSHTTEIFVPDISNKEGVDVDPWELFHNMLENLPPKAEWDEDMHSDLEDMMDTLKGLWLMD